MHGWMSVFKDVDLFLSTDYADYTDYSAPVFTVLNLRLSATSTDRSFFDVFCRVLVTFDFKLL